MVNDGTLETIISDSLLLRLDAPEIERREYAKRLLKHSITSKSEPIYENIATIVDSFIGFSESGKPYSELRVSFILEPYLKKLGEKDFSEEEKTKILAYKIRRGVTVYSRIKNSKLRHIDLDKIFEIEYIEEPTKNGETEEDGPIEEKPPQPSRIKTYEKAMYWANKFLENKNHTGSLIYGLKAMTFDFIKDREHEVETYLTNLIENIFEEDTDTVIRYTDDIFENLKTFSKKNKSKKYTRKIRKFIDWYVDELEKNYGDRETIYRVLKGIERYFSKERRVRRVIKSIEDEIGLKKKSKLDSLEEYPTAGLVDEVCGLTSMQSVKRNKMVSELTKRTFSGGVFSFEIAGNILNMMLSGKDGLSVDMSLEIYLGNLVSSLSKRAREKIASTKIGRYNTLRTELYERFPGTEPNKILQIGKYAT